MVRLTQRDTPKGVAGVGVLYTGYSVTGLHHEIHPSMFIGMSGGNVVRLTQRDTPKGSCGGRGPIYGIFRNGPTPLNPPLYICLFI